MSAVAKLLICHILIIVVFTVVETKPIFLQCVKLIILEAERHWLILMLVQGKVCAGHGAGQLIQS